MKNDYDTRMQERENALTNTDGGHFLFGPLERYQQGIQGRGIQGMPPYLWFNSMMNTDYSYKN